jgi:hypothetical protein
MDEQPAPFRVLVRDPKTGQLVWREDVTAEQALAYSNGDIDWQRAGSHHDAGLVLRFWRRILG